MNLISVDPTEQFLKIAGWVYGSEKRAEYVEGGDEDEDIDLFDDAE